MLRDMSLKFFFLCFCASFVGLAVLIAYDFVVKYG